MTRKSLLIGCLTAVLLILTVGCTKPYKITQTLEQPLDRSASCEIASIDDALPPDFKDEDKPSAENIARLRNSLEMELLERELFNRILTDTGFGEYLVTGRILDFKRGSGVLRFIFGFLGSAHVTVELELRNGQTDEVLFAGNFRREITSEFESGDKAFDYVAEDFAKALEKHLKEAMKAYDANQGADMGDGAASLR